MSGHNKWSSIKHKKAATDAKRAKAFTVVAKNITLAAQSGGGDPQTNPALATAIEKARAVNMPKDNIQRAINRGTGEGGDTAKMEEVLYEAMGPDGSAMLILCVTDNTNRALTDVKTTLKKNGGKFVSGGGVLFQFSHVGQIVVNVSGADSEAIELVAIEQGAEDIVVDGDHVLITVPVATLHVMREALKGDGYDVEDASVTYVPQQNITLSSEAKKAYDAMRARLDDIDDVQEIYDNVS